PPISDAVLLETLAALDRHDNVKLFAARELGVSDCTVGRHYREAISRGLHLSEGAREAMAATHLSGAEIAGGYRHVYSEETGLKTETVRWSVPKQEMALETLLDRAVSAFSSLPAAPAIPAPKLTSADLLTVFPLF